MSTSNTCSASEDPQGHLLEMFVLHSGLWAVRTVGGPILSSCHMWDELQTGALESKGVLPSIVLSLGN